MASDHLTALVPTAVPHPGEAVVEYLEFREWSQRDLARRTGLAPKTISEICNGKAPITPTTALAFEKVLQRPAHFWLNLQRQFDEAEARREELKKSAEWREWAARFPLKEIRHLVPSASKRSDVDMLLTFLGVSSPKSWTSVWDAAQVSYRQTRRFKTSVEAVSAWVRATELVAAELEVGEFNEALLRSSIPTLRRYTRERVDEIVESVQKVCAAAGMAFVLVPEFRQTGISGCARWLGDKKALIALSLRYKTDDQMWFTFFHELGHVLLHRKRQSFVLDNAAEDLGDKVVDPQMQQYEDEANRFSRDTLIPPKVLSEFLSRNDFRSEAIHDFAAAVGVSPGIVVGRLQFESVLEPHQGNALKQRLAWHIQEDE
jgi:HTH-type transcriptional regulator / antitoxin HigA